MIFLNLIFSQVLQLIRLLFISCKPGEVADLDSSINTCLAATQEAETPLASQDFLSKKITNKIVAQLQVETIKDGTQGKTEEHDLKEGWGDTSSS